jgi:hypothetical protein
MEKKKKGNSRREFLDKTVAVGAGLGMGAMLSSELSQDQNEEHIRLITADGKIMEVKRKHVKKRCAGKVSNKTLMNWIEKGKNKNL